MGQNCSTPQRVSIPTRIWCFPYFSDENELLFNSNRACQSLSQFRGMIGCISNAVLSPPTPHQSASSRIFTSATRYLVQYLLSRLCTQMLANGKEQLQANCKAALFSDFNSQTANNSSRDPSNVNSYQKSGIECQSVPRNESRLGFGTLEEALIQVKIEKAIANSAVAELHAKLVAVDNRCSRLLLTSIPVEDRRLEVVPALTLCEEILQLFRDPGHVFMKQPLISAPFVVTFGGIYAAVAEMSLALIESYQSSLVRQMMMLKQTLIHYKAVCVEIRVRSVEVKPLQGSGTEGQSMIDGAFTGMNNERSLYLDDKYSSCFPTSVDEVKCSSESSADERVKSFEKPGEALETYKKALVDKYDSFFEEILNVISSFSGFEEVKDSSSGNLDD